ncbi:MAG: glycosyltransferase family 39 protein [Cyanobacteria bacterium P01_F01_bin.150]
MSSASKSNQSSNGYVGWYSSQMAYCLHLWHTQPWLKWLLPIAWIFFIGWIAFLWQLGDIGLVDETEPLFAEAARQMTVTGDWVTPYFNGDTRFDKPPLIYWLMAIAYTTIGVNEWAVRLPSALSAIALTGFIFYILKQFGFASSAPTDPRVLGEPWDLSFRHDSRWAAAWIGAGAIALNLQMILWARQGVSDMLLNTCMGAALMAFFCGYAQPYRPQIQRRWYLSFYIFAALAVLTKGPVGIVLPGMVIVAFLLYMGNLRAVLREMQVLWGSIIFLLMTVPWYVLVTLAHGRTYVDDFFGYHNVERFTSVVNNHSAPWFFYFLVVLLGFVPWSVYVPWAIARIGFWRRSHWQNTPRHAQLGIFAVVWFLVIFVFFTIATTKLPSYTIPLLPAASILVALAWSDRQFHLKGLTISHIVNLFFLCLLAGAVWYSGNWLGDDPVMPDFSRLVVQSGILKWGGMAWGLGAIASLLLILKHRTQWIWGTNLIAFILFLGVTLFPALPLMDSQRQLPLRQIASTIVETSSQETAEIVMVGFKKPTLVFYSQRPVTYIYGVEDAIAHIKNQGKLKNIAAPTKATSRDVFLVGRKDELETLPLPSQKYESIDEAGVYQLLRLHLRDNR